MDLTDNLSRNQYNSYFEVRIPFLSPPLTENQTHKLTFFIQMFFRGVDGIFDKANCLCIFFSSFVWKCHRIGNHLKMFFFVPCLRVGVSYLKTH